MNCTGEERAPGIPSGKKRILICSNFYPPHFVGGAELIAHEQAKIMNKLGHEVIIFAGEDRSGRPRYSLRKDTFEGLSVYRVALTAEDYGMEFANFCHPAVEKRFDDLVDAISPDVVHMHNIIGLSAGLIHCAKRRRIRTVCTLHDHWGFCHKNTLLRPGDEVCEDYTQCATCVSVIPDGNGRGIPIRMRRDYLALQLSEVDVFISPSRYLAGAYRRAGIPEEKIRVIWYGVDLKRFALAKTRMTERVRFSFIGYLGRHKGIHTLIEALSYLSGKERVRINIVGVGDQSDLAAKKVRKMGWKDVVRFWGRVDNRLIGKVYGETDVLILPSIWPENQPVTITEAMAASIPVIGSRIGGIPELLEDGVTGYLCNPGDAGQLAAKMMEFVISPEKVERFGENGRRRMEYNSVRNRVDEILKLYAEPLETEAKGRTDFIISCAGTQIDPKYAEVVKSFLEKDTDPAPRFVLREWMDEDHLRRSKLLLVIDRKADLAEVVVGLEHQLPLVVPEENKELTSLCRSAHCGLYYRNVQEAKACVRYLMNHESEALALGQNGYRIFEKARGHLNLTFEQARN